MNPYIINFPPARLHYDRTIENCSYFWDGPKPCLGKRLETFYCLSFCLTCHWNTISCSGCYESHRPLTPTNIFRLLGSVGFFISSTAENHGALDPRSPSPALRLSHPRQLAEALRASELAALKAQPCRWCCGVHWLFGRVFGHCCCLAVDFWCSLV